MYIKLAEKGVLMKNTEKWDKRFLEIAHQVATWSKDPSTKVGAIIVGDKLQIVSQGYNGFPRNIEDKEERLNIRELKYKFTIHAEANAIYNALYNGSSVQDCTLYCVSLFPCSECAKAIIQSGIKRVVSDANFENSRWKESNEFALAMFKEAGLEVTLYEEESKA
jgi:dCMP deaminase